jgi:hypothetical protein
MPFSSWGLGQTISHLNLLSYLGEFGLDDLLDSFDFKVLYSFVLGKVIGISGI